MVNVDVDAVNCHVHGRANFGPRVDRMFKTRPGRLIRRDMDVPVHPFLNLICEFSHTFIRLHASCARAVTATWCLCKIEHVDRGRARDMLTSTLAVLLYLPIITQYSHGTRGLPYVQKMLPGIYKPLT